jgi:phage/plasmid-associated DNA primase
MVKIIDFIKAEKLKFTYMYTYFNKKIGKKSYKGLDDGWHNSTYEELLKDYENTLNFLNINKKLSKEEREATEVPIEGYMRNQFMIRMDQNKYFVIDVDEEKKYNEFISILKDNNIYKESCITKSFSGKKDYYKRHFWFKVDDDRFNKLKNGNIKLDGIDLFYTLGSQISEWDDAEIDEPLLLEYELFDKMLDILKLDKNLIFENENENKKTTKKANKKKSKDSDDSSSDSNNEFDSEDDSEDDSDNIIEDAVLSLDVKRANEYNYWFSLACAFKNDNLNLKTFHKFSAMSDKYNKYSVDDFLKNLKPKAGYSTATIFYYLKEDNLEVFKKLNSKRKDIYKILDQLTDNDFAKIFFNLKPNDYIYSSTSSKWYNYNEHNIIISYKKEPTDIYSNISNTLSAYIEEQKNSLQLKNKNFKKYSTILKKAYTKINKSAFPKSMLPYLQNLYRDDGIENKFDKNTNLIAFKNGVYDIELGGFRAIKRQDCITKGLSYNYPTKSNTDMRKYILKILGDIFDKEDLDYYLKVTALSLFTNKFESAYIHTGSGGRNGKSLLGGILTQTFEHLVYSVSTQFFNSNTKTGQANQELAELKDARILLCSEPDTDNANSSECKIKNSLFKRITGNDIISARANFSDKQLQYIPTFTIHMFCNDIPEFSKMEKAIQQRLRIIKYKYQFVSDPKNEYQKLVDTSLKDKSKNEDFKNEFALLLFEYAKKNINLNIVEMPQTIKASTNEYFDDNNILKEWLETYYKYDYNLKKPHKIRCSNFKKDYLDDMDIEYIDDKKFINYLRFNDIELKIIQKVNHVLHYVRRTDKEISDYKKSLVEEKIIVEEKPIVEIKNNNDDDDDDDDNNEDEMSTDFNIDF